MTGERVAVTSNGREYTWRGTRWTYEPKNNHGRTEVHRTSRLHFALCELASLRAQVAALAGEDAVERALTAWYSGDAGSWEWVQSFSPDGGDSDRKGMREALDAARGGEG